MNERFDCGMADMAHRQAKSCLSALGPKPDIYMVSRKWLFSAFLALELGGGALSGEARCLQAALHRFGEGYWYCDPHGLARRHDDISL